jgi:uncharacterized protein YcbK (DUF882 family)
MTPITANFTVEELACPHCQEMRIPIASVERLQRVRDRVGIPLNVTSGYRCPTHNAAVSATGTYGPHTVGAFDITISGPAAYALLKAAFAEGFTGIGINQKGGHRFVHLDDITDNPTLPRPAVWTY